MENYLSLVFETTGFTEEDVKKLTARDDVRAMAWGHILNEVKELRVIAEESSKYAYASKQKTNCAICGENKHTPLKIAKLGGYICLTCIDKELNVLLANY